MLASNRPDQTAEAVEAPTILIAEDEFLIRLFVSDHLRDVGFQVVEASNADEAIALLQAGAQIDLVFTDIRMPGHHDGMGLLDYVRSTRPDVPVVVTSGHLEPKLAYDGGARAFVSKPCDPEQLTDTLRTALAL